MNGIRELEHYLRSARILDVCAFPAPSGAHPGKLVILDGGIGALAKPADANDAAPAMVPREVGAWVVARTLGWPDLVAATVRREIPSGAGMADAAVIVAWPAFQPDVDPGFDEDDRWRAAVFDFIVNQQDRNGHNWLAVPQPSFGSPRLKLVDHGHCFGYPTAGGGVNSTFFNERRGDHVPTRINEALCGFLDNPPNQELAGLVGDDEGTQVETRVQSLLSAGSLPR